MNDEAARQRALLATLAAAPDAALPAALALRETGARARRGLEAYRANAEALADRALTAVFPTVRELVGGDDFAHLARAHWHAHPPTRGDLGAWGADFPAWLEAHPALAGWPYLGDCARLDLALHTAERAADAELDAASLGRLESVDPARLRLELMPGSALLRSRWPIAGIHAAHRLGAAESEPAFRALRAEIAAARGEHVLVVREGWRAVVHRLTALEAQWLGDVLDGVPLAAALERAGDGFDFAAWLGRALQGRWLKGLVDLRD
jgi:hypothetical protein